MTHPLETAESLSAFKRDTASIAKRLKKTGEPLVLTVHGKAEMIVQDADAFRKLQARAALAETAEMVAFLKRSAADIARGDTVPAEEFVKSLGRNS